VANKCQDSPKGEFQTFALPFAFLVNSNNFYNLIIPAGVLIAVHLPYFKVTAESNIWRREDAKKINLF